MRAKLLEAIETFTKTPPNTLEESVAIVHTEDDERIMVLNFYHLSPKNVEIIAKYALDDLKQNAPSLYHKLQEQIVSERYFENS